MDPASSSLDRGVAVSRQDELGFIDTALVGRIKDRTLFGQRQLHGGYGCMAEEQITQMLMDGRLARICAGANEPMEIVARSL
ncbi:MAG: acyl-CoA dehydrogenase family protein [Mycobacterium sp.]|uniref:acyl-CoA dehydrogenase family protein n=1 Tax=Mycobacterium sp. TaxID=1785 RepID=UPI003C63BF92